MKRSYLNGQVYFILNSSMMKSINASVVNYRNGDGAAGTIDIVLNTRAYQPIN